MAITVNGGVTIGQQGLGSTVKMKQENRVQVDVSGTYVAGGKTGIAAIVKAISGIGAQATIVDIRQAGIARAGGYLLDYDRSTDALRIYGTGSANKAVLSELGAGDACDIPNVELIVEWV